ncbi:MAG: hypothetical protein KDD10_18180 [Phaeodactylibacter sp.]|nr:hypothetical protein [Phaeodactylibacter sp.]MCB9295327.1 hypothetical protein [Lewinellaceae bacterium]
MDIKKKAKAELESRVRKVENLIAEKGVGSSYLSRAKRVQRNINLAIAVGGIITIAGLAAWALNRRDEDER